MSLGYQAVGWNRTKKIYDTVLAAGLVLYLGVFVGIGSLVHPNATAETLLIRALGTAALLLLHVILCIGPLCRLDRRFLPLLVQPAAPRRNDVRPGAGARDVLHFPVPRAWEI